MEPAGNVVVEGTATPPAAVGPGVLVAEDDPDIRRLLEMALPQFGLTVWSAADGAEAVQLFGAHQAEIRAAVLDVRMPGLDGPRTLAALRQAEPALPCCFVTGYAGGYTEGELLALGAARVFTKPFSVAQLGATLCQLCGLAPPAGPEGGP